MSDDSIIDRDAIFVRPGIDAGPGGSALQAHARRRLKNIGGKRAAARIEFDLQITGVGDPHDLLIRANDNDLGQHSNQDQLFSHRKGPASEKFLRKEAGARR